jgi:exopolysaccharide biosynthesis polyprenyl glycosylphosphotransferase
VSKRTEKIFLFLSDFLFINLAYALYFYFRVETGWILLANAAEFLIPMFAMYLYWLIVFSFAGLYQHWFVRSRFDEFSSVFKAVSIGCIILFFAVFIDDTINDAPIVSRFLIILYWLSMVFCVGAGRVLIRGFQRNLLQKGIGLRKSIIVGTGAKSSELYETIEKFPQLGYKITGFVSLNGADKTEKTLGVLSDIPDIIRRYDVSEILIALEQNEKQMVLDVIKYCSGANVHLKIMPDTYEIVSGLARTNEIYGVPLIEVMPEIMSPAARLTKRIIDIGIAVVLLLLLLPALIVISILIKVTSKGPLFYRQIRVGKNGRQFTMYKFRSMIENAEEYGPEWAGNRDKRITPIGRFIRKTHIDELPQMINVLKNEMSIVGPRPERPYFVEELKKEIPYYYKRLSIKPGITGWAQVKFKYDTSVDDVKDKLQFDFFYIENMSLKLDFKIMINTFIVVLLMKGQ